MARNPRHGGTIVILCSIGARPNPDALCVSAYVVLSMAYRVWTSGTDVDFIVTGDAERSGVTGK